MATDKDDLDVDARLNDGWQFQATLDTGLVRHYRDHDNIASVRARIFAAKASGKDPISSNAAVEARHVDFSGARAVEGEGPDGDVIGPVRGKGFVDAMRIVDLVYATTDGNEVSGQAFEAAVALLDVQRAALAQLGQSVGQGADVGAGGESAGEGLIG